MENLTDNNAVQGNRSGAIPASLGKMLSEARERLGLSVADVAVQTKFAPRQIEALEADDFKHLPEPAFLRGFVRSYAKILHLDVEPLLAALPQAKAAVAEMIPPSVEVPYPGGNTSQKQTLILLGAALLLAMIAVGFSVWHFTTPLRQSPSAKLEASVALPAEKQAIPEPPVQQHNMTASSSPVEVKRQSSATAAQSSVRAAKTKAVQAQPQIQTTETTPQPQAIEAGNIDVTVTSTLRLVFGEESWTEIKDKDGKVLSSQINPPGSELLVEGSPPFSMLIGHAASASLFYQGKQVDLKPYINQYSEVAHLKLK
jgi:cytoskeleton protein RodZ